MRCRETSAKVTPMSTRGFTGWSRTGLEGGRCARGPARSLDDKICARLMSGVRAFSNRLAVVEALTLITFALLLAGAIQTADSASLSALGKHRSSRDRGK